MRGKAGNRYTNLGKLREVSISVVLLFMYGTKSCSKFFYCTYFRVSRVSYPALKSLQFSLSIGAVRCGDFSSGADGGDFLARNY